MNDHRDNTGWKNKDGGKVRHIPMIRRPKRQYTAPIPAKKCVVSCKLDGVFVPIVYDFQIKSMFVMSGKETLFPSKREAKKAIWHILKNWKEQGVLKMDDTNFHDDDFEINNVQEAKP